MATKKTTKKKNGPRTRRYGCITYRSEPQDNPDCRGRCSPPARMVSEDGRTKVTQIRYRRRNLDVVRKNCACDLKPSKTKRTATKKTAKKTASKTTAKKTVKTPAVKKASAKTPTKTVKKPVAKPTAKKTAAPPVKVTPLGRYIDGIILGVPQPIPTAVRTILPTDSVYGWYVRAWPDDDLALEIDHRLKFAQVKKAMGTSAIYKVIGVGDSVVRERIETGIREFYRDGVPINPALAPMTAKKTASKTVSCGCAVTPAKSPSKPKTVTCGCAQTPAKVREAILNKAEKEGMNRKELDKHISVVSIAPAKPEPVIKAPASWKVPTVGGRFEGKAPAKKAPSKTASKKTPAKKVPASGSRGVQGRFDAGALKAVAQFVHRMDKDLDMPIFVRDAQFVDSGRVLALRLVSRMPGKSFVGLPLDPSKRDLAVPIESFIKRLNSSVMDVYYQDGRLYYAWKDSPGLSVSTAVRESGNPNIRRFVWSRTRTEGDIMFRTSQAGFAKDVKKAIESTGFKLPKMLTSKTSYKDTAMSMCPPDGQVGWDGGEVGKGCAGYSMYWMNRIAGLVAKAKGSQCIVTFKPNFPLRVVCDFGPYMTEIMLAPIVTPEE